MTWSCIHSDYYQCVYAQGHDMDHIAVKPWAMALNLPFVRIKDLNGFLKLFWWAEFKNRVIVGFQLM